jgi:SPP1 gp7 family putative phage head morphogenesis protein
MQGHPGWQAARRNWLRTRRVERQYATQLRRIARNIGEIVSGLWQGEGESTVAIEEMLRRYAEIIEPWARSVSERMLAEVARRDAASWQELGRRVNRALRQEIATTPTGPAINELLEAEVGLIKNMPLEAEARIRELAAAAVTGGRRWPEVAEEILKQENISRERANLIARTETGRAATTLVEARAVHVGSPGYIWRTARDPAVRPLHHELEGTFHRWNDPPVAGSQGELAHPGAIYNCRCFPEIVIGEGDIGRQQGPRPRSPAFLEALRQAGYGGGDV